MKNYRIIKKAFREKIYKMLEEDDIVVVEDELPENCGDDSILVHWKSDDLKKTMRVQENEIEGRPFIFDGFTGKTGIDLDYIDLGFIIEGSHEDEKVQALVEFYKMWFIDDKSVTEIENILKEYEKKFNVDKN